KNLGEINLQHGDKVGDQVLRYVSRATRANIRIYDLLGRWIGAKFLLVLPNANIRNAMKVLERVNQSIATIGIHLPQEDHINIEVGIGVTTSPVGDSLPLYILIEQANEALQKTDHPAPENLVVFS
ncbi:MAG: GGDEF domain-containing protein, partial [Anaerolineae bacterium]|nr:GGDEF domain-containing protein [Anaerolineae bacterium]